MRLDRYAVAIGDCSAIQRKQLPDVGRLQIAIGDAQWLDRRRQRHHRELRNQHESYGAWQQGFGSYWG